MASKKMSLGRGLDTIFSDNEEEQSTGLRSVRTSLIEPKPDQPRQYFDEEALAELAGSIRENGVLQPILVRERPGGFFEIIAGERRWRASRLAGLEEMPVIVLDADDRKVAEIALVENLQREDLDPFEEAAAYRALMDDFDLTQEEVAAKVGKSRPAVANVLRLAELPEGVRTLIRSGELSAGHGRALLALGSPKEMEEIGKFVAEKGLSVRATEAAVKQVIKSRGKQIRIRIPREEPDYIGDLERRATEQSGRIVRITAGKKRTVTVEYQDNEDLEELLALICGDGIREG